MTDELREDKTSEDEKTEPSARKYSRRKKSTSGVSARKATAEVEVKPVEESKSDEDELAPVVAETAEPAKVFPSLYVTELGVHEFGSMVPVRSTYPGIQKVQGAPSGEVYVFEKPGAVVSVRSEDVEFLMSKNHSGTRGCCGGSGELKRFELI